MFKRINRVILLALFYLFASKAFSQIACTPTAGCSPLSTTFTGVSGASAILWNFGDAVFSNINNPTHTYSSIGTFTVTYTATVASAPVTYTLLVKVFGKPTPNFSYVIPPSHCAPMTVPFTDLSTGTGSAPITSWQWSYGDGGVATFLSATNPSYIYTIPGTFSVTLIVKDANGCDSSLTKPNIINVSAKPTVVINSNPLSLASCTVPFTATFNGTSCVTGSPLGGGLTYNWGFGNGQTSTLQNPAAITYTANGTYTVSLTCTDNNFCSNSVSTIVSLLQPKVKVKIPDTICYGYKFIVKDTSLASYTTWDFGDGYPLFVNVPNDTVIHTYYTSGNFTVTVTAYIGGCLNIKTFPIYVQKVIANFTSTPPAFTCYSPFQVSYVNTSSSNATSFQWFIPNHNPAPSVYTTTATNPTYSITQGSMNPYTIYQMYTPNVMLIAISNFGCRDTVWHAYDSLRRVTSYFYTDKTEGCVPLTVKFTDSSFSTQPINYYEWNFGDGSPIVSGPTSTMVVHTYTAVGSYSVTHIIQNVPGCRDTSFIYWIKVVNPPAISFTFSPTTVCPNQPVTVNIITNPADSVNHYHIDSDLGMFSGCVTNPNPSWNFNHTGVFGFSLTAWAHGCKATAVSTSSVTVKGPIVRARYFTRCDSSYKIKFVTNLQDAQYAVWNYGDGSPTFTISGSNAITSSHTYSASGNYTAIVTGYNALTGCPPFRDTLIVTVRKILASFTSNPIGCAATTTTYSAFNSQDVMNSCNIGYTWYFGNYPPQVTSNPVTTYTYPPGIYNITLVVLDTNNCADTAKSIIKISSVTASVSLTSSVGCLPVFSVTPINNSTSDAPMTYVWDFGDGSGTFTGIAPPHTYTAATSPFQTFTITVVATNTNGCTDTYTIPITVNAPQPNISSVGSPSICVGTALTINANNVFNVANYNWNLGTGTGTINTSVNSINNTYTLAGAFTASLTTTDVAGCKGSTTFTVYVQNYPIASFVITNTCSSTSTVVCTGCPVTFSDTSVNPIPGPRVWDLSSGGPIVPIVSPSWIYLTPGSYPITLTVTSTFGCPSIAKDTVRVYGAKADFFTDKNIICKGDAIIFTIKDTLGVFTWNWDYGDGSGGGPVSPTAHSYTFHPPGGSTNVTLIYWSSNLACKYSVVKPITIRNIIADFDRNNELVKADTIHCLGVTDLLTSTSTSATAWYWNFGDGNTSTIQNPSHVYGAPGTYTVVLAISDTQYGCKDTLRKPIVIIAPPQATITAKDTCAKKPSQLNATGASSAYTYIWHPGKNLTDSTIANPVATLTTSTNFTVEVIDLNGCTTLITHSVYIQMPPPPINWDTSVVIGQIVNIPGYGGTGFTYSWTPLTDLSCGNCPYPVSTSTVDITYYLLISDSMNCFSITNKFSIHVDPKASVDVPTAFTPNGDGINDIIYVDGWGIKKLNYFRIYNRWGELLFESNDIKVGWDGTYKGVPQNMETYVWQVSVETYADSKALLKTHTFKLIR